MDDFDVTQSSPLRKKIRTLKIDTNKSDVQLIGAVINEEYTFSPLSTEVCRELWQHFNVDFERISCPISSRVGLSGAPCTNKSVEADANCFFRVISLAVTGR